MYIWNYVSFRLCKELGVDKFIETGSRMAVARDQEEKEMESYCLGNCLEFQMGKMNRFWRQME
jgi:hypothetical protein